MKSRHRDKRLLSVQELANYLGLSPITVRIKMKKGVFPFKAKRLGGLLKFDLQEVDKYINDLPIV
jgi:excisionase family DNA binding protein